MRVSFQNVERMRLTMRKITLCSNVSSIGTKEHKKKKMAHTRSKLLKKMGTMITGITRSTTIC